LPGGHQFFGSPTDCPAHGTLFLCATSGHCFTVSYAKGQLSLLTEILPPLSGPSLSFVHGPTILPALGGRVVFATTSGIFLIYFYLKNN
jgi:hypothetical protein